MPNKKKHKKQKPKLMFFKDQNYELEYKVYSSEIKKLHPEIEIKRFEIINNIKNTLHQLLISNINNDNIRDNTKNLKQLSNEFIIRFIFLGISENKNKIDPLFPFNFRNYTQIKKDIKNLIIKDENDIISNKIIDELDLQNRFNKASIEVKKFVKKKIFQEPNFKITSYFKNNIEYKKIWYGESFIILNSIIENKLKEKYKGSDRYLDSIIWCLVFRYFTINDNNQLILNVHNDLDVHYNNYIELFASSINSYWLFCSLFYDIEKYFQSFGNFFNIKILKGFYKANMPYDEEIMKNTCKRLVNMLKKSEKPLACLICMPVWDFEGKKNINPTIVNYDYGKYEALNILENSGLIKYKKILSKNQINYLSINNMKKIPASNTYIIVIENEFSNIDFTSLNKFNYL
jgi:hypothetical protein